MIKTVHSKHVMLLAALVAGSILGSCNKKETAEEPELGKYILAFRSQNGVATESDGDADYILSTNDLMSGTISAKGNGKEQAGWCYYAKAGDTATANQTFFSFGYDLSKCIGYHVISNRLSEKGKFTFKRMDCVGKGGDDNTLVAVGAPWGGGSFDCQIQLLDANTVTIKKTVTHPIYSSIDTKKDTLLNSWPSGIFVDGNKLYVAFYPLNGTTWETPNTDTAYVSIYSYPELAYQKTIKDTRTGPIGYYGDQTAVLEDEKGDHYLISSTSLNAGFTQTTKPSGILRIKAGEDSFDAGYFFDVEGATGHELLAATYVGNGIAVGRVAVDEIADPKYLWGTFSYSGIQPCKLVVLDLINKTVREVAGVPKHGGQYQTPWLVENGKVYASINTGAEVYVYQVDPVTATGKRGAKIEGREIQAFWKK